MTETPGDASSLQIDVSVGSGSCNSFNRVELNETDAEVEVLAYSDSDVSQDVCTDDLTLEKSTISLEAPLGDRTLKGCIPPAATESLAVRDLTEDCLTVR